LLSKIISIDLIFCGLQKQFTTKADIENFKLYIVCIFKETKAKFLFHKNFCDPFVPFVVLSFD